MKFKYKNTAYTLQFGFGHGLTPGVGILCGMCIVAFLVTQANRDFFYPLFGFAPSLALKRLMLWQFATANFLHVDLTHLAFNLFGIYMFGGAVEQALKVREFIKYFLICGAGGFTLTTVLWLMGVVQDTLCIGASAGVYGLLLAFSLFHPNQKVLVFFIIPLATKWLALLFGCLELLLLIYSGGVSQMGHLGGLMAGLAYFLHYKGVSLFKGVLNA